MTVVASDGSHSYPLLDEKCDHEDRDGTDDGEDDDDTGFPLSKVFALDELGESNLAAGDERHVEGGHCSCFLSIDVSGEFVEMV